MRQGALACVVGTLGLLVGAPVAPAAVNLLVADQNAASDDTGLLLGVSATGAQTIISSNQKSAAAGGPSLFSQPNDVVQEASGNLLVVDTQGFGGTPRVSRVDPATGRQTALSTNAISGAAGGAQAFSSPNDIQIGPDGQIYVTDADTSMGGSDSSGSIIRVNASTGAQTIVASDTISSGLGGESAFHNP